jgi:hypothetical protein
MSLETDLSRKVGIGVGWTSGNPHPTFPASGVVIGSTTLAEIDIASVASNTAAGASFGGTGANVEAVMGSGTRTFAANTLAAGSVIKGRVVITTPTTVSTDTFAIKLRLGGLAGTAIYTLAATDVANANKVVLDYEIAIRTSTTAYATVVANTLLGSTQAATTTETAVTGLDLTAALTLVATGAWSTENANSATVQHFTATVTQPA